MSWDVAIVRIKGPFRPIAEVDDGDYASIGSHAAVVRAIRAALPTAEWSEDKTHATYDGGEFSIEFDLSSVDDANTVVLNVRGTGDPIPPIVKLVQANGWKGAREQGLARNRDVLEVDFGAAEAVDHGIFPHGDPGSLRVD